MSADLAKWSGDGELTQRLLDRLRGIAAIAAIRVEDAPASRSEADYHFISNEIFIGFARRRRVEWTMHWGFLPVPRAVFEPAASLADLQSRLTGDADIGAADYADDGMLQYLRSERIVAPYQTRGFKHVELVRLYEMPARPVAAPGSSTSGIHTHETS